MLVAIGTTAGDIGVISLVTLVVFAAQPLPPERALSAGLLAAAGGLLQTFLALALWPLRRYEPERRALGNLYLGLARAAAGRFKASEAPPASAQSTEARKSLATLGRDRTLQGERYRALLNEAERIRLSLLTLARLRSRIRRESEDSTHAPTLDQYFESFSTLLECIGSVLLSGAAGQAPPECLRLLHSSPDLPEPEAASPFLKAVLRDARFQIAALGGQLRSAFDLVTHSTPTGRADFEEREARKPWKLRVAGSLATLRANLTLESAACRHAVRLAVCVALGTALGRGLDVRRAYWIPMTIAIVLKPDFTSTFSRGVLRIAGTLAGLALATVLFHAAPLSLATQVGLIAVFMFLLRCIGPANYGVFVVAVSALVVLLIALTGVAPDQVIAARALNTGIGGALALLAYLIWPTWERTRAPEALAHMLDSYRDYFHLIAETRAAPHAVLAPEMDRTRQVGRLARSNFEASVDRIAAEPRAPVELMSALTDILAGSHRMVHAMMALEAGIATSEPVPDREAFRKFANDVEKTLYFLAAALRGFKALPGDFPDLRAGHSALLRSGDCEARRYDLLNVETDRLTDSINTLRERITLLKHA